MNKVLLGILLVLALGLIGYNSTVLDFEDPFVGDSFIAIVCIIASLCAIVLLLIFNTARKIQKKIEDDA